MMIVKIKIDSNLKALNYRLTKNVFEELHCFARQTRYDEDFSHQTQKVILFLLTTQRPNKLVIFFNFHFLGYPKGECLYK